MTNNNVLDFLDDINPFKKVGNAINDLLDGLGELAVDCINGGLSAFASLLKNALKILTLDTSDATFKGFWTVVNKLTGVLQIVATTLMVLLFLYNLNTATLQSGDRYDEGMLVRDFIKLVFAIVLVNNAVIIVTSVFNMGARLAGVVFQTSIIDGSLDLALPDASAQYLENGLSGVAALVALLVYVIGAIAIVVCGIMITLEIYTRIFKMYILIPFSTISFSTFVMGDGNRGNEVFHGYIKSILSVAIEASIIMLCVSFTYSMLETKDGQSTMNKLFPAFEEEGAVSLVNIETLDDAIYLCNWLECADNETLQYLLSACADELSSNELDDGNHGYDMDNVSQEVIDFCNNHSDGDYGAVRLSKNGGKSISSDDFYDAVSYAKTIAPRFKDEPERYDALMASIRCTAYSYQKFSWGALFMIFLQVFFPIAICTGAVKGVSQYSGMILGR